LRVKIRFVMILVDTSLSKSECLYATWHIRHPRVI
jgi:hypothetical protein